MWVNIIFINTLGKEEALSNISAIPRQKQHTWLEQIELSLKQVGAAVIARTECGLMWQISENRIGKPYYQSHSLTTRTSSLPGKHIPFHIIWQMCLIPKKMFFMVWLFWFCFFRKGEKKTPNPTKPRNVKKFNQYYPIFLPSSGCSQLIDIAQAVLEQTNQSHHGIVTGSASLEPMISYHFFFFSF